MNELTVFNSEQFGEVRTVTIDNEPWFVAADVQGVKHRKQQNGNSTP